MDRPKIKYKAKHLPEHLKHKRKKKPKKRLRVTKSSRATRENIKAYWVPELVKMDKFIDRADAYEYDACFACGVDYSKKEGQNSTERAHILAKCCGGSNEISNFHLLCEGCHKQSELLSGEEYWRWFEKQSLIHSSMYYLGKCEKFELQNLVEKIFPQLSEHLKAT